MKGVKEPEKKEAANDLGNVAPSVLVDTLVVRLIDWVVTGAIASELGSFPFASVSVNRMHLFNRDLINKLFSINFI